MVSLSVGHRQRKAGASEKAACITDIGHWCRTGVRPADKFLFGLEKRGRSSLSVVPPSRLTRHSPSGFRSLRICAITPGRSSTQ